MLGSGDRAPLKLVMDAHKVMLNRMEKFLRSRLSKDASAKSPRKRFVPSMTISRQCGAGLDQIGPKLVEYLSEVDSSTGCGWALFDQSLISKIVEDDRLPTAADPFLVENAKFPVTETLEQILDLPRSQWSLFNYSADTIRKLCDMGNAIVIGRAGNFVTADLDNTFHVRLVGSSDRRLALKSGGWNGAATDAGELVEATDRAREKFVRRYTGTDIENSQCYHLVFNTDDFSADGSARLLAESLLDWANEKSRLDHQGAA